MKKKRTIVSVLTIFLLLSATFIFSASIYGSYYFPNQNIDEMSYYFFNGANGTSNEVIIFAIKKSAAPFLFILLLLLLPFKRIKITKERSGTNRKKFKISLLPNKSFYKFRLIYAAIILVISLFTGYRLLEVDNYIAHLTEHSTLMADHYVNGADVKLTFPKEKRNLIILYLESMESSLVDRENGGGWEYALIPELTDIAKENVHFSHSDQIGGAYPVSGTGWTVAGLVSTTSGIPLKIPINGESYTSSDNFLDGAYTLGDVLKKEGYNLEVMFGSDANFGERANYFKNHGNYKIFDVYTAIEQGKMSKDDWAGWGFVDTDLFKWAKEEITELASSEKPFSFSFLTVNTHFPDGYLEDGVEEKFDTQYENVYAHSSKQVAEFVNWLQKQDFYENTTLVITGDHLSMQSGDFFSSHLPEGSKRTIYNAFINSAMKPIHSKNRTFTSLDIYPTILASMGVTIEGDRLGLGTNLFSARKTLPEEMGFHYVNEELAKNSNFYNLYILKDDNLDFSKKAQKWHHKD